jgi:hypothetical protein
VVRYTAQEVYTPQSAQSAARIYLADCQRHLNASPLLAHSCKFPCISRNSAQPMVVPQIKLAPADTCIIDL